MYHLWSSYSKSFNLGRTSIESMGFKRILLLNDPTRLANTKRHRHLRHVRQSPKTTRRNGKSRGLQYLPEVQSSIPLRGPPICPWIFSNTVGNRKVRLLSRLMSSEEAALSGWRLI